MAYRRTLTLRSSRLFTSQRPNPSISHFNHQKDDKEQHPHHKVPTFMQNRSFGSYGSFGSSGLLRFHGSFKDHSMPISGMLFVRNMSSGIGSGEKIELLSDIADVLGDKADVLVDKGMEVAGNVAAAAPAVSEVAVAAADSWLPVAALQYAIDGVHNFTGCNWWLSIVITTLIIRTLSIPIMINQLKATSKLTILRPELEAIKQEMQDKGMSPSAVAEGQTKMKAVFTEHGVSTFTPLKGLFIQGPVFVSFFLAIQNMVEKVPSFTTGGASWFLDLTTADAFYFLPCLTAFSFWITVELNMQEGLEGNPAANTMKNVSRGFAALTVPLTASFPKALFCYWITSNLFSLVYGSIMKRPAVKKLLNIPIIVPPPPPPAGESKPALSFFESLKKYAAAQAYQQRQAEQTSSSIASSTPLLGQKPSSEQKSSNPRVSPSSVLSHRIKNLEKEVKGRKKNKRR